MRNRIVLISALIFSAVSCSAESVSMEILCRIPELQKEANPWLWDRTLQLYVPSGKMETVVTVYLRDPAKPDFLDVWCVRSNSGRTEDFFAVVLPDGSLKVMPDQGKGGRRLLVPGLKFEGKILRRYQDIPLTGSRGDVSVRLSYEKPFLKLQFHRKRNTGFHDDAVLSASTEYAVSLKAPGCELLSQLNFQKAEFREAEK